MKKERGFFILNRVTTFNFVGFSAKRLGDRKQCSYAEIFLFSISLGTVHGPLIDTSVKRTLIIRPHRQREREKNAIIFSNANAHSHTYNFYIQLNT